MNKAGPIRRSILFHDHADTLSHIGLTTLGCGSVVFENNLRISVSYSMPSIADNPNNPTSG
ncbi:MAG: hypothetical protein VX666_02490, partial [Candidatus Thermoplasmatota archaeon]|nr:hypothetical protein [Candidatus Thermoplasmatota archaeon]